jgi:hypothetical protein
MKKTINSGWFLIILGLVYLTAGIIDVFVYQFCPIEYIQIAFVAILASPILIKPIGKFVGVDSILDSFRKNKEMKDNVVNFPDPTPDLEPPKSREHYRIGYDNGLDRVTLTLLDENKYAVTTLSMNYAAAEQMIRMIRSAFPNEEETND